MGVLKKPASGVPCLRRSGFAQAGPPFAMLTYSHVHSACQQGLRLLDVASNTAAFPSRGLRTGLDGLFEPSLISFACHPMIWRFLKLVENLKINSPIIVPDFNAERGPACQTVSLA